MTKSFVDLLCRIGYTPQPGALTLDADFLSLTIDHTNLQ